MTKKKAKAPTDEGPGKLVDSYRAGYRTGTREGFEWCIRTANELEKKATTADGKRAMKYVAEMMMVEVLRRQPGAFSSGSG